MIRLYELSIPVDTKPEGNFEWLPVKPEELRFMTIGFLKKKLFGARLNWFKSRSYDFEDVVSHLVQESLRILDRKSFDPKVTSFSTYYFTILQSVFSSLLIKLKTEKRGGDFLFKSIDSNYPDNNLNYELSLINKDILDLINSPTNPMELTELERKYINRVYLDQNNISQNDLAEEVGVKKQSVNGVLRLAFEKIREYLKRSRRV